jgi:hypothetical protein
MKSADVIRVASSYVGQTETPNNSGFKDSVFQKKMEEVGWEKTLAWCSYFAELVFKEAACDAETKKKLGTLNWMELIKQAKSLNLEPLPFTGMVPVGKVTLQSLWAFLIKRFLKRLKVIPTM